MPTFVKQLLGLQQQSDEAIINIHDVVYHVDDGMAGIVLAIGQSPYPQYDGVMGCIWWADDSLDWHAAHVLTVEIPLAVL